MSNRSYSSDKGSSRSARDVSRRTAERDDWNRHHGEGSSSRRSDRSRSRSPGRHYSPESRSRHSPGSRRRLDDRDRDNSRSPHETELSDEEVPAPPPPPRITKISIDFSKPKVAPIKMNIGGVAKASAVVPKPTVASVFNTDDDEDEPEEMPAEARMRMRNIGRETPTSAGPNSFGKTKQGFCDAKKLFEKNLKNAMDSDQRPQMPKFPQTIYKIKGP